MRIAAAALAGLWLLLSAGAAAAEAPEPLKPFDLGRMPGRWYEIARTPTPINRNCQGGSTDWAADGPLRFKVTALCRKGSPTGPAQTLGGKVRVLDPKTNAKVRFALFGGLLSQDYWIFDHADDYSWLIMGTPNRTFVALFASSPQMPPAARAQALDEVMALGFDVSRLSFPAH
jgi:apolipoprotein D and lipocalin family protein